MKYSFVTQFVTQEAELWSKIFAVCFERFWKMGYGDTNARKQATEQADIAVAEFRTRYGS